MGNSIGGKKRAKIMKITGETIKLKTPLRAGSVTKDYPGYVLLDSEAVKHFGIRAKPLGLHQELKPKRVYFLVELPKFAEEKSMRKVRSGINMSAKDRLESLMLAKRSVSDLSLMQQKSSIESEPGRLKMRLPKAEVQKLMSESKSEAEAAEKILQLCLDSSKDREMTGEQGVHWKEGGTRRASQGVKPREEEALVAPLWKHRKRSLIELMQDMHRRIAWTLLKALPCRKFTQLSGNTSLHQNHYSKERPYEKHRERQWQIMHSSDALAHVGTKLLHIL